MKEKKMIDTGSGISPLGPSNKVKASIRRAIKEIRHIPDSSIKSLEKFFLSKFGLSGERLLFANSVSELLCSTVRTLGPRKVIIVGPALRSYEEAALTYAKEVSYFGTDEESGFAIDADKLMSGLIGGELIFAANPNRITGKLLDGPTLSGILKKAVQKKVYVVIDESLIEFTDENSLNPAAPILENVITVRTTAYFYGLPGLELAYAVSGPSMIRSLRAGSECSLNALSVAAAKTALRDESYKKLMLFFIADEKKLLSKEMEKLAGLSYLDSDSNMYLVKLEHSAERLLNACLRAGLLIRNCGDVPGLGKNFLRFSVMGHDKNLKLLRLMRELVRPSATPPSSPCGRED